MTNVNDPRDPFIISPLRSIRDHWPWFLGLGILLVILGSLAVGAATFTTFLSIFLIGVILLAGGITKVIYSFWSKDWGGFFISLLVGILYGVTGGIFLAKPVQSAAALTLLIGSLFVVSGCFKIVSSLIARFAHWGWLLFSGIISLILGILVLAEWPQASLWIIGLFVGIDMIIYGWTWVILSISARPRA
jgi:uncharacterized membrane protein HdeD (DUF308 family)